MSRPIKFTPCHFLYLFSSISTFLYSCFVQPSVDGIEEMSKKKSHTHTGPTRTCRTGSQARPRVKPLAAGRATARLSQAAGISRRMSGRTAQSLRVTGLRWNDPREPGVLKRHRVASFPPGPRFRTLPPFPPCGKGTGAGREVRWRVTQQDSATEGAYETNVKRSLHLTTALPSQHGTAAGKEQTGREA